VAGDWIKFEVGTSEKPEVWAIADALDIDPDAVVGKLLRVWAWFGNAPSVSAKLLDRLVGVTGFCKTVVDAGWLKDENGQLSISNFDRHNGETAKTRALTAKRVAKHKNKGNDEGNASLTPAALPKEDKDIDKKKATPSSSDDDVRFADFMFQKVATVVPGLKQPKLDSWANTIRLMREQDKLTHHRMAEVFVWANKDPFWKTNILSPEKLRKQFPQLVAKMENASGQRNQPAKSTASDRLSSELDKAFGPGGAVGSVLEGDFQRIGESENAH
jgi:hypothetical protein